MLYRRGFADRGQLDRQPVEHARRLLRLHRLVHGHEIADRGSLGVAALALGLARFVLGAFQLVEARFDTALRILEQALAQLELVPLLLDLLAPLAEPLEQRPLGLRRRLTKELDGRPLRPRILGRDGRLRLRVLRLLVRHRSGHRHVRRNVVRARIRDGAEESGDLLAGTVGTGGRAHGWRGEKADELQREYGDRGERYGVDQPEPNLGEAPDHAARPSRLRAARSESACAARTAAPRRSSFSPLGGAGAGSGRGSQEAASREESTMRAMRLITVSPAATWSARSAA